MHPADSEGAPAHPPGLLRCRGVQNERRSIKEIRSHMERSDLISLLSVCFAALSALYARWAATQAKNANAIAVSAELKTHRLSVFATLKEFLHFCSIYSTMQKVNGTRDLVAKIDSFKWEVEQHGPLDMPEVDDIIKNASSKAWQLQRLLDRLKGPGAKPVDNGFEDAEANLDKVIEWFATQEKGLKGTFEPYLRLTQQRH
jgi:hypothetical protein